MTGMDGGSWRSDETFTKRNKVDLKGKEQRDQCCCEAAANAFTRKPHLGFLTKRFSPQPTALVCVCDVPTESGRVGQTGRQTHPTKLIQNGVSIWC